MEKVEEEGLEMKEGVVEVPVVSFVSCEEERGRDQIISTSAPVTQSIPTPSPPPPPPPPPPAPDPGNFFHLYIRKQRKRKDKREVSPGVDGVHT